MRIAICTALYGLSLALAAPARAENAQQTLMKTCNADAKSKAVAGAARKDFMSHCLKGEPTDTPAKPVTPQERMKACNADPQAKTLKGDARKAFMSSCLKK